MALSVPQIGVFGLKLAARHPSAVVAWTLVGVTSTALLWFQPLLFKAAPAPIVFGKAIDWAGWLRFLGSSAVDNLPVCVVGAVLICAIYRAVLRPSPNGFAWLRLGGDELRVGLLLYAESMLVTVVGFGLLMALGQLAAAETGLDPYAGVAVLIGSLLGLVVLLVWLGVKTSMFGPMLFLERRLQWTRAWRLTGGRFWRLLGAFAIAWMVAGALFIAQYVLGEQVSDLLMPVTAGSPLVTPTGVYDIATQAGRANFISEVVSAALSGLIMATGFAPAAVVYRDLAVPEDPASAFD